MQDQVPPAALAYRPDPAEARWASRSLPASGAIVAVIAVAALYVGRDIFVPLALAILLSFVLSPIILRLRRWHVGRVPSVAIAVALAFAVISGIGGIVGSQLARLAENLPRYQSTIEEKIHSVQSAAASIGFVERASSMLQDFQKELAKQAGHARDQTASEPAGSPQDARPQKPIPVEIIEPASTPFQIIQAVVWPLLQPLATTGVVIIFLIFILLYREDLRDRFIRLAGAHDIHRTTIALDEGIGRLSRYFLAQSAINGSFGVVIGVGLSIIGVPNPVLWGIMAALLRFVPYIGAPIAAVFPAALAIAVDPGWSTLFWTLGLFLVTETILGQVAEPLLYGRSTGVSPVAVVVSAMFWTWLWGPVGLLLSTPLTVCLVVFGRNVEYLEFLNVLLGDEPPLAPDESFYQRVLAGDPDEAAHQAEKLLKDKPLSAYYDEVAIKGLALAQLDVNRGLLDQAQRRRIKEAVDGVIDNLADHDDVPTAAVTDGEGIIGRPPPVLAVDKVRPAWPEGTAPVLCVAGRDLLDEAAAAMLAQLIQKRGIGARVVSSQAVSPANVPRLDPGGVTMICLSYLEPSRFANARFLVRRLRHKLPQAKILLGLWTETRAEIEGSNILTEIEADFVATSLAGAVDRVAIEASAPDDTSRKTGKAAAD
jgi:predicted PurR-regulated permease PerM